jgi:hypothetical protein
MNVDEQTELKRRGLLLHKFIEENKVGNGEPMMLEIILKEAYDDFYKTWNNAALHGTAQCDLDIHNIWLSKWFPSNSQEPTEK